MWTGIVKALVSFGTDLIVKAASRPLIEWVFFRIADGIVASTATPHDDEFLRKLREVYDAPDVVTK